MTNLETTMDRGVLLNELRVKLAVLRAKLMADQAPHVKEMRAHVAHVARVLTQAAREIASGKLKPEHGTWCKAQSVIQERVGPVPEGTHDLKMKSGATRPRSGRSNTVEVKRCASPPTRYRGGSAARP